MEKTTTCNYKGVEYTFFYETRTRFLFYGSVYYADPVTGAPRFFGRLITTDPEDLLTYIKSKVD